MSGLQAVTFHQITQILDITDQLNLSREWVEIPLSPGCPGTVKKLTNGKIEIVVDAEMPFEDWLGTVKDHVKAVMDGTDVPLAPIKA